MSNESAAIGNLRTVLGAENAYFAAQNRYGTFEDMLETRPPYLDGNWVGLAKSGYRFHLTLGNDGRTFQATAMPEDRRQRAFFVDNTGVIRYDMQGTEANAGSRPIGQ